MIGSGYFYSSHCFTYFRFKNVVRLIWKREDCQKKKKKKSTLTFFTPFTQKKMTSSIPHIVLLSSGKRMLSDCYGKKDCKKKKKKNKNKINPNIFNPFWHEKIH